MSKCKVCGYKKHPSDGSCACGMVVLDPNEVLRDIRARQEAISDEPSDDALKAIGEAAIASGLFLLRADGTGVEKYVAHHQRAFYSAGRASMQRELEEARAALLVPLEIFRVGGECDETFLACSLCAKEMNEPHTVVECAQLSHAHSADLIGKLMLADARTAAIEAGQVNAAVEMLREAEDPADMVASLHRADVADWLESRAKAPREAEAVARERLGRWLAQPGTWRGKTDIPEPGGDGRPRVLLMQKLNPVDPLCWVVRDGDTWAEAINAALDAAEKAEA